jgi:hypothetical protein
LVTRSDESLGEPGLELGPGNAVLVLARLVRRGGHRSDPPFDEHRELEKYYFNGNNRFYGANMGSEPGTRENQREMPNVVIYDLIYRV